jgi:hypothetical protein
MTLENVLSAMKNIQDIKSEVMRGIVQQRSGGED